VILPLTVAMALRLRETAPDYRGRLRDRVDRDAFATLVAPGVASAVALGMVGMFAVQSFLTFYPTFLEEFRGVDSQLAGLIFGGAFLLSAIAQPMAGWLSDRAGRDIALSLTFSIAGLGLALSVVLPGTGVYLGAAVLGIGISWPGVIQANIIDALPGGEQGLEFGMARSTYLLVGATGSVVTGTLADVAGWPIAYGTTVALLGVTAIAVLIRRGIRPVGGRSHNP
jgi:MFS family permease